MALNNTTADTCAQAICTALNVVDAGGVTQWKTVMRAMYAQMKIDIVAQIAAGAINTTGSASAQQGPAAPVNCITL